MFIEANIRYNMTFSSIKCKELKKKSVKNNIMVGRSGLVTFLFSLVRHLSVVAIFAQEEEDKEKICCPAAGHG